MKRRAEFLAANAGARAPTPGFVLLVHPRGDGEAIRGVGLTVSRKVGNAVIRNRLKRRLRVLTREVVAEAGMAGADHVLIGAHGRGGARFRDAAGRIGGGVEACGEGRLSAQARRLASFPRKRQFSNSESLMEHDIASKRGPGSGVRGNDGGGRGWIILPLILLARFWQIGPSRLLPPTCRYAPSCSAYAIEAWTRYGALAGTWLAVKRFAALPSLGWMRARPPPLTFRGLSGKSA